MRDDDKRFTWRLRENPTGRKERANECELDLVK
jgi:hypothetical protein